MTYSLSVVLAKLSLLFLYLRLSPDRNFRILVISLIGIVIVYSVAYQLLSIFGCRPNYASWDAEALQTARCVDKETIYMILSIANIIMDVVILLLPLKIVIPLQMARRQKVSVILLFATGALSDPYFPSIYPIPSKHHSCPNCYVVSVHRRSNGRSSFLHC